MNSKHIGALMVKIQENSGMNIQAWTRANKISKATFYRWKINGGGTSISAKDFINIALKYDIDINKLIGYSEDKDATQLIKGVG